MQSIRREHPAPHLIAHEREDVHVCRVRALRLFARDGVEAFDALGDRRRLAERRAGVRQRPIRLWQRIQRRGRRVGANAPVDHAEVLPIAVAR